MQEYGMKSTAQELLHPNECDNASTDPFQEGGYPFGKRYSHYVLFLLVVLFAFDFMDRQVIATMFTSLKAEWGLSDKQLGLLVAVVNLSIAVLAFPSAILVDKWNRKKMVGIMATVWGVASLACAFTGNYWQLLALRFMVGAGEAGYNPGGNAIIQSYFPPKKCNSACGIFQSGAAFGGLIGILLGGFIVQHLGWRHAFGIVALPGIFFAILIFFIKEPVKTAMTRINATTGETEKVPFLVLMKKILTTQTMLCIFFAQAATLLMNICIQNWMPSYFSRMEGLGPQDAAVKTAGIILCGGLGAIFGGIIGDKAARFSDRGPLFAAVAFMIITSASFFSAFTFMPQNMVYPLLLFGFFMIHGAMGPAANCLMLTSPSSAKATTIGTMVVVQNLFGMGLGALISGILSDLYRDVFLKGALPITEQVLAITNGDIDAAATALGLKAALATLSLSPLIAGLCFYLASRSFKSDMANAEYL